MAFATDPAPVTEDSDGPRSARTFVKYPDPLAPIESDINITFGRVFDIARSEHPDAASHLQSAAQQDTTAETFGSAAAQFGPGGGGAGEALATIN